MGIRMPQGVGVLWSFDWSVSKKMILCLGFLGGFQLTNGWLPCQQ
jgi:hypothetical protein